MTVHSRRRFLKGTVAGSLMWGLGNNRLQAASLPAKLVSREYTLELRHAFTLAGSSRTSTPALLIELHRDGLIGYGEASMPARFGETPGSAITFLNKISLEEFSDFGHIGDILSHVDTLAPENHAAKTAFDLALHDWVGKKLGQPWHKMWGLNLKKSPRSSFTIGIDTPEVVRKKVLEAEGFHILKVKLGRDNDREMIETIRSVTDRPLTLDPNEGWTDRNNALKKLEWMATQGAILCEQPLPRTMIDDQLWLKERSPIPIIADESVFRLKDIRKAVGLFHGINIKLMKCTGLHEARRMIELAKGLELKIMLGCMTETSCAIAAASQISPLVDWVDLDGAALIANDPFTGVRLVDGRITPSDEPGLGIRKTG